MSKEYGPRDLLLRVLIGLAMAAGTFILLGTVSALWDNPFFVRMTPAGGWEITLLAMLSILFGLYGVFRNPLCSIKTASSGGLLGLIGIACPVCNKVLLFLFGGQFLLAYFEPIRIYVAAAGVVLMGGVMLRELILRRRNNVETHSWVNAAPASPES